MTEQIACEAISFADIKIKLEEAGIDFEEKDGKLILTGKGVNAYPEIGDTVKLIDDNTGAVTKTIALEDLVDYIKNGGLKADFEKALKDKVFSELKAYLVKTPAAEEVTVTADGPVEVVADNIDIVEVPEDETPAEENDEVEEIVDEPIECPVEAIKAKIAELNEEQLAALKAFLNEEPEVKDEEVEAVADEAITYATLEEAQAALADAEAKVAALEPVVNKLTGVEATAEEIKEEAEIPAEDADKDLEAVDFNIEKEFKVEEPQPVEFADNAKAAADLFEALTKGE